MLKLFCALLLLLLSSLVSASEPFKVMSGLGLLAPLQPQACVDTAGVAHVAFGVGDQVYYCRVNSGEVFEPQVAFRVPNMSLGMRRGPRITISGESIVISAIGGPHGKGKDGDVLAYRSTDAGKSWIGPVKVNEVDASAREGLHAMTASEDGVVWCVWLDLREKGTQLFAAKSNDGGASWSANKLVYRSPDGSVCECCHPSIIADSKSVHVLFRNSLGGNRDMFLVSSHDGGNRFDPAVRLGNTHWKLNACPMDGGMLAMAKTSQITTIWRRDQTVVLAEPKVQMDAVLGTGEQPWIASDGDEYHTVWTSKRSGDLWLKSSDSKAGSKIGKDASFPVVVSNAASRSVYVFWESTTKDGTSILGLKLK